MRYFYLFLLFVLMTNPVFSQSWKTYPYTPPGSLISFPVDEGRHLSEPVEWWYTTGHITGLTTGIHYSYMLTYFSYPIGGFDGFRILTFSDDDNQIFSSEMQVLNYNTLATDKLDIEAVTSGGTETWKNKYNAGQILPFQYELSAASPQVSLDLSYDALKKPLILGDDGYLLQASYAYTYYYSQTALDITGNITYNGLTEVVTGTAWIDRQYGSMNPSAGTQYEWFSIQLSNGMDLNLWNIFENNQIPDDPRYKILAAYVDENTQYTTSDFELQRLSFVYMPDQQRCYAQSWRLTSPLNDVDLLITTGYSDSEVQMPFRFYEGSTQITGTVNGQAVTGVGFAELLHSYEAPDIQIMNAYHWKKQIPLQWQLNNPDDGNPLTYDITYSTDNQASFQPVASGLTETQYTWDTAPFTDGDTFWLKVTGQSVDGTLTGEALKEFYYDSTAGIRPVEKNLAVYPNPVKDFLVLKIPGIRQIEIFNPQGKLVRSRQGALQDEILVDVKGLQGIYWVKIYTEKETFVQKIICR